MPAITASNTWAVQILLVAFSRRMCCSRVPSAMRNAIFPRVSRDTPISRPGMRRLNSSRVVMKAACGPPKPNGTPNRCELPTTTSAPHSPGGASSVSASRSVAAISSASAAWARSATSRQSTIAPSVVGYWTMTAKTPLPNFFACASPTTTFRPDAHARVRMMSIVCGWHWRSTKTVSFPSLPFTP